MRTLQMFVLGLYMPIVAMFEGFLHCTWFGGAWRTRVVLIIRRSRHLQVTMACVLFFPVSMGAAKPSFCSLVHAGGNMHKVTSTDTAAESAKAVRVATATAVAKARKVMSDLVWLDQLDLSKAHYSRLPPKRAMAADGKPMSLGSRIYKHGVGMWSRTRLTVLLNGHATEFVAKVGVDDSCPVSGSVSFQVWVDGREVVNTGVMVSGEAAQTIAVSLAHARKMELRVGNGGDGSNDDAADWADARIYMVPGSKTIPETIEGRPLPPAKPWPNGLKLAPTPRIAPVSMSHRPAIHGPRIIGSTPGRPFLYLIPATGQEPLVFTAQNLPKGLALNKRTGIIFGSLKNDGRTEVHLKVSGPAGTATRRLVIVGGMHQLALTPPMGWSSWYVWGGNVSQQKMERAADLMVSDGLAAQGYQYVNIDDGWQGKRCSNGILAPNKRFPDMKALGDYIHSKGLKFGIYSSPGPTTCGGNEGSYQHWNLDAKTWSSWGVDFLKGDLCGYLSINSGSTLRARIKSVELFTQALDGCGRDIVYTFGGWGDIANWGAKAGLNAWRIAADDTPKWTDVKRVALAERGLEQDSGPGHWNDADFLMVGRSWFGQNRPTMLTGNEQVFQFTYWSLCASPLILSCNLGMMSKFTKSLVENDEVIDVDQDPLGKQAIPVALLGKTEVLARPLWDGTQAVGLLNWGNKPTKITVYWSELHLKGAQAVRNLWRKRNMGYFTRSFTATVGCHGAILIKVGTPSSKAEQSSLMP